MRKTFKCAYCGAAFERNPKKVVSEHVCCSKACARKLEAVGRRSRGENHRTQRKGPLPYETVTIRMTKDVDLFPDFRPETGCDYCAERYRGQYGLRKIGYVISVNGHRVNIREDECVEV